MEKLEQLALMELIKLDRSNEKNNDFSWWQ